MVAGLTLSTVDKITKEIYQGKIQDQLQDEAVGFKRIESTSEGVTSEVGGKYVTFPLRVRRNPSIGYRNEYETLQAAGQQGYQSVRIGLRYGYGRVELTGQLMTLAEKNFQSFASAMDKEMTGLKNDIGKDTNRIFYGDGTGTVAVCGTAGTTVNTVTVRSAKYLELDEVVDVLTSAGADKSVNQRTITAIAGNVVTLSGAAFSTSVGDILVRTGNFGREPNGLGNIVNSGTLHQLSSATEPKWQGRVNANGGTNRALSEGLMIQETDNIRVNGGKTSLILYSLGVRRAYFNLLSQQRRYPSTTNFAGGLTGLAFNNGREIPCVEDVDCPDNTLYGLDEDSFKIYRESPWSWMDRDGNTWKWVANKDAYEAILFQYWELGCNRRNANFVIRDLTEG